jgi:hypothetical protein
VKKEFRTGRATQGDLVEAAVQGAVPRRGDRIGDRLRAALQPAGLPVLAIASVGTLIAASRPACGPR